MQAGQSLSVGVLLIEQIGRGAYGTVWEALDQRLGRRVAVKVLSSRSNDRTTILRFEQEARTAAALRHRAIVSVYEFGYEKSNPYIIMELIEGVTLRQWSEQCELNFLEIAQLLSGICEGMAHAHESGVIHRDLKPENILVDLAGNPHITDFGFARTVESHLTNSDMTVGTLAYMSPEQISCEPSSLTPKSDLFSLGVIFYELLVGKLPFRSKNPAGYVEEIKLKEPVDPRLDRPSIPEDLVTLCLRCLEKEPTDRMESAKFLAEELNRFANDVPIHSLRIGRSQRVRKWCRRNRLLARSIAAFVSISTVMILTVMIFAVLYANQSSKFNASEQASRQMLVDSVMISGPEKLEQYFRELDELDPLSKLSVIDEFKRRKEESNDQDQLRAAMALTRLGIDQSEHILDHLAVVPGAECRNIVNLLKTSNPEYLQNKLREKTDMDDAVVRNSRFRLAIVAGYLGHAKESEKWLAPVRDPDYLGDFLVTFSQWKMDTETAVSVFENGDSWHRYASSVSSTIDSQETTLGFPTWRNPEEYQTEFPNTAGQFNTVLVEIENKMTDNQSINRSLMVAQTETTCGCFEYFQFEKSREDLLPQALVSFPQIAEFCNRLSDRSGLQRAYLCQNESKSDQPEAWTVDLNSSGFRLPTKDEWRVAARALSRSEFFFGQNLELLPHFGIFRQNAVNGQVQRVGTKAPNYFGLYDVHGNIGELCHDSDLETLVLCGGHFLSNNFDCSANAFIKWNNVPFPLVGFRVVRSIINKGAKR